MENDETYYVIKHLDKWVVKKEGDSLAWSTHGSRESAQSTAVAMVKNLGGHVEVQDETEGWIKVA